MVYHASNKKDCAVHLRAFDGSTVMIPGKAKKVPVPDKFSWHPHPHIIMKPGTPDVAPVSVIRSPLPPEPGIRPPRNSAEAQALNNTPEPTAPRQNVAAATDSAAVVRTPKPSGTVDAQPERENR